MEEPVLHPVPRPEPPQSSWPVSLLRLMRPRQWVKNVLVLAAPVAAGVMTDPGVLGQVAVAFVAFCLASAGGYCMNDARDHTVDRLHPVRSNRPVASGALAPGVAVTAGVTLIAAAIGISLAAGGWGLPAVVAGYSALTLAYTFWLKRLAVMDLIAIAGGFVLRLVGGAVAVGVPITTWFYVVASSGSMFMVAAKRQGEREELGDRASAFRPALARYTPAFLAQLRAVFAGTTMLGYALWAFDKASVAGGGFPWFQLSIVPFVAGVLRYWLLVDRGKGSEPEDLVLGDRVLQAVALIWLAVVALGIYLLQPPPT